MALSKDYLKPTGIGMVGLSYFRTLYLWPEFLVVPSGNQTWQGKWTIEIGDVPFKPPLIGDIPASHV